MSTLEFFFDYLSPYSYFCWKRAEPFCEEHELRLKPRPVLLAKLLCHWGHLGPAEIPPKREFVMKDCLRYANQNDLEFTIPATHPFNPLTALRVSLPDVASHHQREIIDVLFDAAWAQGRELGSPGNVAAILDEAGFDGEALVAKTRSQTIKERLKMETEHAIEKGVFGVPTIVVEGELFWGNDQIEHVDRFLQGDLGYDPERLENILDTESSVAARARRDR